LDTILTVSITLAGCPGGINESLNLSKGETHSSNFSTVNGNVRVADNGKVDGDIDLVNGRVTLGDKWPC